MRALIAGIFGAAASSAAWLAFEHAQQANFGWLVCLIGLVTGFCVHLGATGPSGGTLRGALAVLLTLAGIAGGQKAYAKIMQATMTANEAIAVVPFKTDAAKTDDSSEEGDSPAEITTPVSPESVVPGTSGYSKSTMTKNFSEWDMVWMSLAALAAYVTGKGGEKKEAVVATEERPNDADNPQDPSENA